MRSSSVVKSAGAFRTISEVASELDVPQHVLRFWETRFPQLRPLKRGGGRRYYRPEDVELLRRIQSLLYQEGYTIRGVQRVLRESRGALLPAMSDDTEEPMPDEAPGCEDAAPGPDDPDTGEDSGDAMAEDAPPPGLSDEQRNAITQVLAELRSLRDLLRSALA